jgi:hypothetical protein
VINISVFGTTGGPLADRLTIEVPVERPGLRDGSRLHGIITNGGQAVNKARNDGCDQQAQQYSYYGDAKLIASRLWAKYRSHKIARNREETYPNKTDEPPDSTRLKCQEILADPRHRLP